MQILNFFHTHREKVNYFLNFRLKLDHKSNHNYGFLFKNKSLHNLQLTKHVNQICKSTNCQFESQYHINFPDQGYLIP